MKRMRVTSDGKRSERYWVVKEGEVDRELRFVMGRRWGVKDKGEGGVGMEGDGKNSNEYESAEEEQWEEKETKSTRRRRRTICKMKK